MKFDSVFGEAGEVSDVDFKRWADKTQIPPLRIYVPEPTHFPFERSVLDERELSDVDEEDDPEGIPYEQAA